MIVVVPIAGLGSRVSQFYGGIPKPLIMVKNKPMILWALKSIEKIMYRKIFFITLKWIEQEYHIKDLICKNYDNNAEFVFLDQVTEGQLSTVMTLSNILEIQEDVLIVSGDTYVQSSLDYDINNKKSVCAGLISVCDMPGEQWSFARVDNTKKVVEVAEKKRISHWASTGMYYFSCGAQFVFYARQIIEKKETTKGEYYIMPVYQKYLEDDKLVKISIAQCVYDMGTPQGIRNFELLPFS